MKQSTLETCYHVLVNALADREQDLARVESLLLMVETEEQKAEVTEHKQYYEKCIEEINEAIAEVEPELRSY